MKFHFATSFASDYQGLPRRLQTMLEKKLEILLENPKHPSLRVKKMEGFENVWEARITKGYRFTFRKEKDTYLVRRAGSHDILKHP